ncbi:MAG: peptidylprolyl isomerase [Rhodothermales bacterium]|nr:peptidylprolyl isomerase [Rhodothermales bacterium]
MISTSMLILLSRQFMAILLRSKTLQFVAAFLLLFPVSAFGQIDGERTIDEIVAVVGDNILLRSEVNGYVFNVMQQSQQSYSDQLWFEALDNLINQKVLAEHASRDTTIEVTDDQVDQLLDQRVQQLIEQVGGQTEVEELYGKSIIQIKDDLRDDFRDQLLADQFQSRKIQKVRVTPSEVRNWFAEFPVDSLPVLPEAVRLSHIVRFPEVTDAAREDAGFIITAIRDSIVTGGAAFEDMAEAFSDDPGSATRGGRYSSSRLDDFVPEFAAVASRIEPGVVSEIFETQFGLHILRVNERRGDLVDLNQILIQFDRRKFDETGAIALLNTLKDSVESDGADFASLAKEYSEESFSSVRGGRVSDPRNLDRNLYVEALGPTWARTLITMEKGEISEPAEVELLDGQRGFHIILLEARIPEHKVSLDTDYALIENLVLREKQTRVLDEWFVELRKDVYIDIKVDIPATAAVDM